MKQKYKGPIISTSGGLLGAFSKHIDLLFEQDVWLFFWLIGWVLFFAGANMIFSYHKSEEYKNEKQYKSKQPWE